MAKSKPTNIADVNKDAKVMDRIASGATANDRVQGLLDHLGK